MNLTKQELLELKLMLRNTKGSLFDQGSQFVHLKELSQRGFYLFPGLGSCLIADATAVVYVAESGKLGTI